MHRIVTFWNFIIRNWGLFCFAFWSGHLWGHFISDPLHKYIWFMVTIIYISPFEYCCSICYCHEHWREKWTEVLGDNRFINRFWCEIHTIICFQLSDFVWCAYGCNLTVAGQSWGWFIHPLSTCLIILFGDSVYWTWRVLWVHSYTTNNIIIGV